MKLLSVFILEADNSGLPSISVSPTETMTHVNQDLFVYLQ